MQPWVVSRGRGSSLTELTIIRRKSEKKKSARETERNNAREKMNGCMKRMKEGESKKKRRGERRG